jgi:hypothetical protein
MNPTRARRGLWLAVIANSVAITGCQDARLQTEIDRLQVQLKQADERVAVATAQIEVANTQIAVLGQAIEQARAETRQAKSDAAQQIALLNETAALERAELEKQRASEKRQLEKQNAVTVDSLNDARRELAVARNELDKIAQNAADAQLVRAATGVWEIKDGEDRFRFAFFPDGEVRVLQYNPFFKRLGSPPKNVLLMPFGEDGETLYEWVTPSTARDAASAAGVKAIKRLILNSRYSFTRSGPDAFAISFEKVQWGLFVVTAGGAAKIQLEGLTPDQFDKPIWYAAKRVGELDKEKEPTKN